MKKSGAGFTLIELLVAISIIAILSVIGMVVFQSVQAKARDSVRKRDLQNLATALEIYYQKNGKYIDGTPTAEDTCGGADTTTFYDDAINGIKPFMSDGIVPKDPLSTSSNEIKYCYISLSNGQYILCAKLEYISDADINNPTSCSGYNFGLGPK